MAFVPKRLASAQLTNTVATYYTTPAATTTIIKQVILANVTASQATASVSLVNSGGTASTANRIAEQVVVPANGLVILDLSQVLATGDFIAALASANTTINMRVSGMEYT